MAVYRELIYRNIETFISGGFPVLRSLLDDQDWHAMVREFIRAHRCESPYFLDIAQEFLRFLQTEYLQTEYRAPADAPKFLLELAHYEWVELALDVSEEACPHEGVSADGDLLDGKPVVSPLAWPLSYEYPVHRLGPDYRPTAPPQVPTFLVVYRNREDSVEFLEVNGIVMRVLHLLTDRSLTGRQVLAIIATELSHPDSGVIVANGHESLRQLLHLGVLCGVRH